ncbi:hypothetical protein Pmar_PMAR001636 [Perkinsus marinus ATCC 50983]|uniref:CCHC-type domain-containing protein n=1 Tax=Perkinsus marinus (strain ATCC 50983 / TXsc) TaxID=423536 RepID=C5K686_PERM5|nr:hypothetical protein Pmar_PMAR001636 [Perkinsus marinus ATCC 50983]EER20014.1 hypothetical protein Pmar_PMAR001636 [Perkinsus marinus ATCC 50983]|eukprot:XP_002788218.1 hypothetical protein Pmar_PMAR001636 [Perkinsus marinus ATCC 50983]
MKAEEPKPEDNHPPRPKRGAAGKRYTTTQLRCLAEGRCFGCNRKSHLQRDCPDKRPRPAKKGEDTGATRSDETRAPSADDPVAAINTITGLIDSDSDLSEGVEPQPISATAISYPKTLGQRAERDGPNDLIYIDLEATSGALFKAMVDSGSQLTLVRRGLVAPETRVDRSRKAAKISGSWPPGDL